MIEQTLHIHGMFPMQKKIKNKFLSMTIFCTIVKMFTKMVRNPNTKIILKVKKVLNVPVSPLF